MVMIFLQSDHIWVNLDARSGQGQVNKGLILTFLIWENKDMFLMQNIPRIPMVPFIFSSMWDSIPKSRVLFYDVTISYGIEEINFGFGGEKCPQLREGCQQLRTVVL